MPGKVHHLDEFRPLIERLEATQISYALIGGLAVAHYGEHYFTSAQKQGHQFPIYSKDIDFCGGIDLYDAIIREATSIGIQITGGAKVVPKPATNRVPGHALTASINGESASIEILEKLPLHNLELPELGVTGSFIELSGVVVLDPCTLLLSKLAAYHERPQGELNNDSAHCAILVEVIPAFFKDVIRRRQERQTDYDLGADAWRLLHVLERGRHPLPGDEKVNGSFVDWLRKFTINWLVQTGRLATKAAAETVVRQLLARHGMSSFSLGELRPLSLPSGWVWAALIIDRGAPTHVTVIDASAHVLNAAQAQAAFISDRLDGGILHTLRHLGPKAASYDAALAASARARYLAWLCEQCGYIQLDGLPADSDVSAMRLRLERLFVPLKLDKMAASPPTADDDSTTEGTYARLMRERHRGATKQRPTPKLIGECLSSFSRLAVLAAPGAGKSTLLKRLAVAYADPQRFAAVDDKLPKTPFLPLFLRCRDLRDLARKPLREIISSVLTQSLSGDDLRAFDALIEDSLATGHALLLIDGLDEISDDGDRRVFASHLHDFLKLHPDVAMVLASREAGFRVVAGAVADVCTQMQIAPLDEAGVLQLCEGWHVEVLGDKPKVRHDARELSLTIWNNERIRNLVVNPLLLTTLLVVRRWVGRLPEKRVTLYGKAIEVLLMTWNTEGYTPIPEEEALPQLSFLAAWMMQQGVQRIGRRQLIAVLQQARGELEAELYGARVPPHEFIDRIELRSSLVMQVGEEVIEDVLQPVYEFRHLTFQEYLAARGFAEGQYPGHRNDDQLASILAPWFEQAKWSEVVILTTIMARKQADEIVRRMVLAGSEWKAEGYLHGLRSPCHLLRDLLADEPQIHAETALAACRLIVSQSIGISFWENRNPSKLLRLASCRFGPQLTLAASQHFMSLQPGFYYADDYWIASIIVELGLQENDLNIDDLSQTLRVWLTGTDPVLKTKACLLFVEFFKVWNDASKRKAIHDICAALRGEIMRLLFDEHPAMHTALGWLIGRMAAHEFLDAQDTAHYLPRMIEIIARVGDAPPGGQMAYALSEMPLMPRGEFKLPASVALQALIHKLWNTDDEDTDADPTGRRAAFVLAWYSKQPWSDVKLVSLFTNTDPRIDYGGVWERGEEILEQLGDEGRLLLEQRIAERRADASHDHDDDQFESADEQL